MVPRFTLVLTAIVGIACGFPKISWAQDESTPYEKPSRSLEDLGVPGSYDPEIGSIETERRFLFPEGMGGPSGGAFFRGEYLFMKPRRRSIDFVIVDPTNQGAEIPEGSIESLEWERRSGFRFGAGYVLPSSGWDIGVVYTYLHSNDTRSLTAPAGGTLLATMTRPGVVDEVTSANGSSSFDYDVVDFELGTKLVHTPMTVVRVFGGPRIAWIDQKLSASYNGNSAVNSQVSAPLLFDGMGARMGGEANWQMGGGISFFTRASGSLMVGDFRSSLRETNSDGATLIVDLSEKYEQIVPVVDLGFGLAWQRRNFRLAVGYEIANWFGMVESRDMVDDWHESRMSTRSGDLSLEGFFFQLAFIR